MSTHSSMLAWEILWTEDAGSLQSMRLQIFGQDWGTQHNITESLCCTEEIKHNLVSQLYFNRIFLQRALREKIPLPKRAHPDSKHAGNKLFFGCCSVFCV